MGKLNVATVCIESEALHFQKTGVRVTFCRLEIAPSTVEE